MKRLLVLLLAAVLCFGMVACAKENKYEELNEMLDDGKYSEAITYILSLQAKKTGKTMMFTANPESNPEVAAETEALLPSLMGSWICSEDIEGEPQCITFQEDSTCTVDDLQLKWTCGGMDFVDEPHLILREGETDCYLIIINRLDSGETAICCNEILDSGTIISFSDPYYYFSEGYTEVTLTLDNWQEYFTFTEEITSDTDAFGELYSISTRYYFALKPEYAEQLARYRTSTGAVEINYIPRTFYVTVDQQAGTYTLGEEKGTSDESTSTVRSLGMEGSSQIFRREYYSDWFRPDDTAENTTQCPADQAVLRIEGTLYLLNK